MAGPPGFHYKKGQSMTDFCQAAADAVQDAGQWLAKQVTKEFKQQTERNTPRETGALREDIHEKEVVRLSWGWEGGIFATLEYAPYVEHGTGLWGPKHAKYKIEPKKPGGILAFFSRLQTPEGHPVLSPKAGKNIEEANLVFARYVMHPGSPGQHMFAIGGAMAEHAMERIGREAFERVNVELEKFG